MNPSQIMGRWPKHYTVITLCVLAQLLAYFDRVNISVASIAMQDSLGWDETTKGLVLSSFFIGYMSMQIIGGLLANKYGGKKILIMAVTLWSFFTLITPIVATWSLSILIGARILLGMGEASLSPSVLNMFSRWVPESKKATAVSIYSAGATLGTLLALIITGYLTQHYGWTVSFYLFGILGLVFVFFWNKFIYNNPKEHPTISQEEIEILPNPIIKEEEKGKIPWKQIFTQKSILALFLCYFCTSWGLYVFIAWLPSYFAAEQGLDISRAGIYSAAPWLAMSIFMVAGGRLSDYLINKGSSLIWVRKSMAFIGMAGSAIALLFMQDAQSAEIAMLLMVTALAFLSINYAGVVPNMLDVAPNHADILYGFINTLGSLPGIIGIAVAGWLVQKTGTYDSVFLLTASIQLTGGTLFLLFAKGDKQIG